MSFVSSALIIGLLIQIVTGNTYLSFGIAILVFFIELLITAASEKVDTLRFQYIAERLPKK